VDTTTSISAGLEKLEKLVASVKDDAMKADGGNRAAGTRVRAVMQEIKEAAQEVRQLVLNKRGEGEKSA
jgi:hypothetical protein